MNQWASIYGIDTAGRPIYSYIPGAADVARLTSLTPEQRAAIEAAIKYGTANLYEMKIVNGKVVAP